LVIRHEININLDPVSCSLSPVICHETGDFAVVYKPPRMHCAPLGNGRKDTLLDWYAEFFPQVMDLSGRKKGEGGLLHRLDFETQGLVLFAKNQRFLDNLLKQQEKGYFIKEYSAICRKQETGNSEQNKASFSPVFSHSSMLPSTQSPFIIESFFRPFGPGRKQVRPVTAGNPAGNPDATRKGREIASDRGAYYRTEIAGVSKMTNPEYLNFTVRLKRGFRHQIRCHLAWISYPVINDPLYGAGDSEGFLALRARGLFFNDPANGEAREVTLGGRHCLPTLSPVA
jgi:23S rRNA pseudouridine1911/1915/1917 synthase